MAQKRQQAKKQINNAEDQKPNESKMKQECVQNIMLENTGERWYKNKEKPQGQLQGQNKAPNKPPQQYTYTIILHSSCTL